MAELKTKSLNLGGRIELDEQVGSEKSTNTRWWDSKFQSPLFVGWT